jgi:hypothetical protein
MRTKAGVLQCGKDASSYLLLIVLDTGSSNEGATNFERLTAIALYKGSPPSMVLRRMFRQELEIGTSPLVYCVGMHRDANALKRATQRKVSAFDANERNEHRQGVIHEFKLR